VREAVGQPAPKLTLRAQFDSFPVFSEAVDANRNYWRLPITAAIPPQRGANQGLDDRHRRKDKVFTGVSVRFVLDYATMVGVFQICYENRGPTDPIAMMAQPGAQIFDRFTMGDSTSTTKGRLSTLAEVNILHLDGPFAVNRVRTIGLELDSPDKSPFNCRMSGHDGGPISKVSWKEVKDGLTTKVEKQKMFKREYNVTSNMSTVDWASAKGYTQFDSKTVDVYFEIGQYYEYRHELGRDVVWDKPLELLFGVKAKTRFSNFQTPLECGNVNGFVCDIYYHR
jgi:hypothetical protein